MNEAKCGEVCWAGRSFRRRHLKRVHGLQRLCEQRVEQVVAGGGGGGEARLQPVAERHQRVDLGDDAVLFADGRDWNENLS
jgi:hypothetical protein